MLRTYVVHTLRSRQNIFKRDAHAHGGVPAPPTLQLTKRLHRDTAVVDEASRFLKNAEGSISRLAILVSIASSIDFNH